MSTELKGYCHPLTPKGKAQVVGAFPWYVSSALMVICFEADPEEVRKLLPEPLEPSATEPASVSVRWGDWLMLWESDKDMIVRNPERAQYKELTVHVRYRFKGIEARRSVFCWVDKDFAFLGGLLWGIPKKLGRVHLSYSNTRLLELNPAVGKVGPGTRFGAFLEAHGERLATSTVKLSRKISPDELPSPFGTSFSNIVYFPDTDVNSKKPLVHRLVELDEEVSFGDVWAAEDATLEFADSELEELYAIRPIKITSAYYLEVGAIVRGTKLVHEW